MKAGGRKNEARRERRREERLEHGKPGNNMEGFVGSAKPNTQRAVEIQNICKKKLSRELLNMLSRYMADESIQ